jgi:cation diffusion facilitator family transporter
MVDGPGKRKGGGHVVTAPLTLEFILLIFQSMANQSDRSPARRPETLSRQEKELLEKRRVALVSVFAAFFLTASKAVIGILTGSLGILSEALHSGLDLVAAGLTYFAVKASGRPADEDHHFGHGKVENLSAMAETLLLVITCVWIIYEAFHRLLGGKLDIEVTTWSYLVVVTSIVVDLSRSRALSRVAKKTHSQALEADALHFSTDIWSSGVVFLGLLCTQWGYPAADSFAALIVAAIVISVSYRLGLRSIDVLMDKAPERLTATVRQKALSVAEVRGVHDIRVRTSGADIFVELSIHLDPRLELGTAHDIAHHVAEKIRSSLERCTVQVHTEPDIREHD